MLRALVRFWQKASQRFTKSLPLNSRQLLAPSPISMPESTESVLRCRGCLFTGSKVRIRIVFFSRRRLQKWQGVKCFVPKHPDNFPRHLGKKCFKIYFRELSSLTKADLHQIVVKSSFCIPFWNCNRDAKKTLNCRIATLRYCRNEWIKHCNWSIQGKDAEDCNIRHNEIVIHHAVTATAVLINLWKNFRKLLRMWVLYQHHYI